MKQLEKLLSKYDFPKRKTRNGFVFDELKQVISFQLPDDYKFFLDNFIEYDCFIGPQCLRLWDADNLLENNYGYNIFNYLTNTLAIGSNMSGECIAVENWSPNKYRIVLVPFVGPDKEDYIEIGSSFTDMLIQLDNGKDWFE
jgi:hypothetical protein